ncbi:mRNA surveillance protein pelota [Candidatus Woesearchaeota archaeon]|nr:mRNA surveillance protein pelota [Candidatus Woesearchaeota archaeon]
MRILKSEVKKGRITVAVQTLDDLWYLSQIIEKGDLVKGRTLRKIQVRGKEERGSSAVKKPVWIKLSVENVEFHKHSSVLRVSGIIVEAPEDVPHAHHTFNFEEGTVATIMKEKWYGFQLKRLKEASSGRAARILICVFDREEAAFAVLQERGYKLLAEIRGDVEKKFQKTETRNFYREIIRLLKEYEERFKAERIIIASPSFWKEELLKELGNDSLRSKLILAACGSVNGGINEVLKRPELADALKQERVSKESRLVEELFLEISRQGHAAYGLKEVEHAVNAGAVRILLLTDSLIQKERQHNSFGMIEALMKTTERMKGDVFIISSENEPGQRLDGLGGIGSLLRYRLEW